MLKHIRPLFMGLVLAASAAGAQASPVTTLAVDFNNITALLGGHTSVALSDQFAGLGLTFSGSVSLVDADPNRVTSGVPGNGVNSGDGFVRSASSFTVTLASGIHANALDFSYTQTPSGTGVPSVLITVYGRQGNSAVGMQIQAGGSGPNGFTWLDDGNVNLNSFAEEIDHITFASSTTSFGVDNFKFTLSDVPTVVPEPATFGLTALALVAAAGMGSRRRRQG